MKQKFFRVKIGYGKDEFMQIDETEVSRAILAQVTGKVFISKRSGTISGNNIIGVFPDWHAILGLNPLHVMSAEDYSNIPIRAREWYDVFLENTRNGIMAHIEGKPMPNKIEMPARGLKNNTLAIEEIIKKKK